MKIQKLEQLRELIKEGWGLGIKYSDKWNYKAGENDACTLRILQENRYQLKSPSGEIIPVEYCEGDLDEHTFKEGDKVRCKPGHIKGVYGVNKGGIGYESGLEFVVDYGLDTDMVWGGIDGCGVYARALELVEAKNSGHIFKFDTQIDNPTMIVEAIRDCDEWFSKGDKFKARHKDLYPNMCLIWNPTNKNDSDMISQFNLDRSFKVIEELGIKKGEVKVSKPKPIEGDIEVRDVVEVIDIGYTYAAYKEMADKLGLTKWKHGSDPEMGQYYKVLNIQSKYIGIGNHKGQYVVEDEGLKIIRKKGIAPQPVIEEQKTKQVKDVRSNNTSERKERKQTNGLMESLLRGKKENKHGVRAQTLKNCIERGNSRS